ncbi:sensor histidine kinase [Conexibacter arvalis]|uniref:histidine kinase n=1 Tax=Conexibacter arvalis TaxID=912552 RepID=A0A840I987_9ACTN|nr:histidine kinase [Conexibacter arvalis]MBB4660668.1 signal transduction histidine kinase [Conexibacter arvalis]
MASSVPEVRRLPAQRELRVASWLRAAGAAALAAAVAAAAFLAVDGVRREPAVAALAAVLVAALLLLLAQRSAGRALASENRRLTAAAATATRELRASRARIAASAERERRRIERDLHDGAQQRLVALRIELELAEELIGRDPSLAAERLRELEREVDEALEELRALAHGVYPPLLADRGLVEALRASAAHAALPVELDATGVGRYSPEIESAVYFCALEALQNACKHAAGADRVAIALDGRSGWELRASVTDDGARLPAGRLAPGAGITNMHDRLAAVGGRLEIGPAPGRGCAVRIRVPVPLPVRRPPGRPR